jgi:hypothetical protein
MKTSADKAARASLAFTLPEALITTTIFLLLLGGILSAHIFGLRMFQINEAKLMASDSARKALGHFSDEVRACGTTYVGTVTNGVFVGRNNGEAETGNGLLIYPTNGSTNFIMYFQNPSDQTFRRVNSIFGTTTILAQWVTNLTPFQVTDCFGNILTNNQNNRVIRCALQIYQPSPQSPVADYYTVETAVTRRSLD